MFLSNYTNQIPYNFSQNFHNPHVTNKFVTTWVQDNSTTSNTYFNHVTRALNKKHNLTNQEIIDIMKGLLDTTPVVDSGKQLVVYTPPFKPYNTAQRIGLMYLRSFERFERLIIHVATLIPKHTDLLNGYYLWLKTFVDLYNTGHNVYDVATNVITIREFIYRLLFSQFDMALRYMINENYLTAIVTPFQYLSYVLQRIKHQYDRYNHAILKFYSYIYNNENITDDVLYKLLKYVDERFDWVADQERVNDVKNLQPILKQIMKIRKHNYTDVKVGFGNQEIDIIINNIIQRIQNGDYGSEMKKHLEILDQKVNTALSQLKNYSHSHSRTQFHVHHTEFYYEPPHAHTRVMLQSKL